MNEHPIPDHPTEPAILALPAASDAAAATDAAPSDEAATVSASTDVAATCASPWLIGSSDSKRMTLVVSQEVRELAQTLGVDASGFPARVEHTEDVDLARACLNMHCASLAAALQHTPVKTVEIHYSGGGDEGNSNEYVLVCGTQDDHLDAEAAQQLLGQSVPVVRLAYRGQHVVAMYLRLLKLDDLLESVFDEASTVVGLGSWWDGEGGSGVATVVVGSTEVKFAHNDYYVASEQSTYSTHTPPLGQTSQGLLAAA